MKTTNKLNTMNTDIAVINAEDFQLEKETGDKLTEGLGVALAERKPLIKSYKSVIDLEITTENEPKFKELRLLIAKNRTQGILKWHKGEKAVFLYGGNFVDAVKNREEAINLGMEEKLKAAENHFENLEKEKIENLGKQRKEILENLGVENIPEGLGAYDVTVWESLLKGMDLQHEEKKAEKKRLEDERIENKRLDQLLIDRKIEISPLSEFIPLSEGESFEYKELVEMSDDDYIKFANDLKLQKQEKEDKAEATRKENERLKAEAEKKEAQAKKEEAEREKAAEEKQALHLERSEKLEGLWLTMPAKYASINYVGLTFKDFETMLVEAKAAKEAQDIKDKAEANQKAELQKKVDEQEAKEQEEASKEAERLKKGDNGILELCIEKLMEAKISSILESEGGDLFSDEINVDIDTIINRIKATL